MKSHIQFQDYMVNLLQEPSEAFGMMKCALKSGNVKVILLVLRDILKAQL